MLDFLSTTDVGRRVPGVEEDDAVSAVSELEVREWMEEQGAGAEEPGARGGDHLCSCPRPASWRPQIRSRRGFFLSLFFCNSLGAHHTNSGQAWAEGKRGACNEPPLRGQRTGNGLYIHILAMISIGRMRVMNKQKKNLLFCLIFDRSCNEAKRNGIGEVLGAVSRTSRKKRAPPLLIS